MKAVMTIIAAVMGLGMAQAQACPSLAGTYSCEYKGFPVEATVKELPGRGFTSYDVDYGVGRVTIHPDNQEHTLDKLPPLDRHARNLKYKATCKGNDVPFTGTGEMTDGSGKATLSGKLTKQGKNAAISFVLATATKTHDINLVCTGQ